MSDNRRFIHPIVLLFIAVVIAVFSWRAADAHCDGMDGPVIKAAQDALAKGDVRLVLIWVQEKDEPEIRRAFEQTVNIRKLSPQARELADMYFFETLVRIHRAGEGAPYSGLKPAGRDLGPAIPAADQALKSGDVAPLANMLTEKLRTQLMDRYKRATAAGDFRSENVAAGREYIEAYVAYIHYVESLYEAVTSQPSGHYPEGSAVGHDEK